MPVHLYDGGHFPEVRVGPFDLARGLDEGDVMIDRFDELTHVAVTVPEARLRCLVTRGGGVCHVLPNGNDTRLEGGF